HFVIALRPDTPQVLVVSPCSGHGYKFTSVIGEIVADLVLDGGSRFDLSMFALSRLHGRAVCIAGRSSCRRWRASAVGVPELRTAGALAAVLALAGCSSGPA